MRLEELAAAAPQARPLAVPDWTLGCFHRRCITYATGVEDTGTRVVWIQSHGLTADIRVPARRPDVRDRGGFDACTAEELAALAEVEGGVAKTGWAAPLMRWDDWAAFQPYDKWPEPGELRRVGRCLIEWAPSGIYVEDWRLQPGSSGLLAGLRLVSENGAPRDGGLVVAGEHAIFSLARREPLPAEAPVQDQIRAAADPRALAAAAFDAETSYCRRSAGGAWTVALSTNPFLEGADLPLMDGFEPGAAADRLVQRPSAGVERVWRVDTLLAGQPTGSATPADPAGLAWLEREGRTLLGRA